MTNFRSGFLQQGQQMGEVYVDILLSADGQNINPWDATLIRLQSDSTTATDRTFTIQGTTLIGAEITLQFMSGGSTACELLNTGNCKLQGTWSPAQYDTLIIKWNGYYWQEVSRSNTIVEPALDAGQILVGNSSNVATAVDMTGAVTIDDAGVTTLTAGSVPASSLEAQAVGLNAARTCIGVFDPTANAGERTTGAHLISVALPAKAIVTKFYYEVITTFTSAADTATIALSVESANDLVSAIAIDDVSDPWDAAGMVDGIPTGSAATMVKTTVARQITATVGVQNLTGGKLYIYADYTQGF